MTLEVTYLYGKQQQHAHFTIYKSFIWLQFDYRDIIYDQPNNQAYMTNLKVAQYNAALVLRELFKLHQE